MTNSVEIDQLGKNDQLGKKQLDKNDQPVKWPIRQIFVIFSIEHMIDVPIAHVPIRKYFKNKLWYLHKGISILNICKIFWYKTVAIFTDIQLQSCIIMTSAREENLKKINLGKGHQCKFSVSGYHILNRSCDSLQV